MKAWVVDQWCEPEAMQWKDVPRPEPVSGKALVKINASAVNFFDTLQIQGKYQVKPPFPFSPGGEISGTIEA
ncbi:MAG: alcohol dehydrogenase catalytic domain-containing protein, partial [Bdellovibrionota bacterium]